VIRVIYLENPRTALPRREDPDATTLFRGRLAARIHSEVADSLGRPMAILRIGSRVPEVDQMTPANSYSQSPPWIRIPQVLSPTTAPGLPPAQSSTPRPYSNGTLYQNVQRPASGAGANR
jgi:hypothetical protein